MDRLTKVLYNLNPLVTDAKAVGIYGVQGCGKSSYAKCFAESLGKEVVEIKESDLDSKLSSLKSGSVVFVDDFDNFSIHSQQKIYIDLSRGNYRLVYVYSNSYNISMNILAWSKNFRVPPLSTDGLKEISRELGVSIIINEDFDGNIKKLINNKTKNFPLYGIRYGSELIDDLTKPKQKFWTDRDSAEEVVMKYHGSEYNAEDLEVVEIVCSMR